MPITTIAEARDEVLNHFLTQWSLLASPPIVLYDDKERDVPDNDDFVRISMEHNVRERQTLGGEPNNRRFRSFGIITVQVFSISGDGLTTSDSLVQSVLDIFEGDKTGEDRVTFRNVSHNEVGQSGPWFQVNVTAEFDYDIIK